MALRTVLFSMLTFGLVNITVPALCQHNKPLPDSSATPGNTLIAISDSANLNKTEKDQGLSKPGRAALYSAIIPGAGQAYNKQYWKIPVVYAVLGTMGYFVYYNNREYQKYKKALKYRLDDDSTTVDEFEDTNPGQAGVNFIVNNRDVFHSNRDLSVILFVLGWGLNVVEANVAAHLKEYDISDDLSLQVKPSVQYSYFGAAPTPVLTLNFRLKN